MLSLFVKGAKNMTYKKGVFMRYRLRLQHALTFKRDTITIKTHNIAAVMARLAAAGWIVQIYYEI